MRKKFLLTMAAMIFILVCGQPSRATVFGELQGIVHDSQHRPIANTQVTVHAIDSQFVQAKRTDRNGFFSFPTLP